MHDESGKVHVSTYTSTLLQDFAISLAVHLFLQRQCGGKTCHFTWWIFI